MSDASRALRRAVMLLAATLPALFFLLFYVYPLAAIVRVALGAAGQSATAVLGSLLADPSIGRVLWFTVWQALASTALTLLLALPGAYVFATYRFRGREVLRTVSTLPFVLPTIVVAGAFNALLGPRGVLNTRLMAWFDLSTPPIRLDQTIWIILLAHVFYNYSVALRIIAPYWQRLNPHLAQAAQMLGADPRRLFWTVTLPLLRPAVSAAAALIFIFTFTSFGVIVVLGGPRYATLEVEIYRQAVFLFDLPTAAALSLLQIGLTLVLLLFYTRSQARLARPGQALPAAVSGRPPRTRRERLIVAANAAVLLALTATPLAALLWQSLAGPNGPTTNHYARLFVNARGSIFFVPPIQAIRNSVAYALAAMSASVALGLIAAWLIRQGDAGARRSRAVQTAARLFDPLIMLPLATSAVTLGFGFIIALNRPPLDLRASPLLPPIAHTLVALPFVVRAVLPALRAVPPSLREAAAVLGADPRRVWQTVDWPLMRRAVLVGALFAFTISMGEFGATVFVARPEYPTLPVAIYRFLGQPGTANYGQAMAMSTLLLAVCAVAFVAIERFRRDQAGEW